MKLSTLVRSFLAAVATASAFPVGAQTIVMDVGRGGIGDYVVASRGDDRSSVCDEYINPNALGVPGCTTQDRGVGDGWSAPFSGGRGLLAGAGVEFDIAGPWTLAIDYSRVRAVFDQTVASTNAQGVDFEKLSNELEVGREHLGTLRTHGVHGVLQLYPIRSGRIRPYGGIGVGYAAMRADSRVELAAAALTRWPSRRGGISPELRGDSKERIRRLFGHRTGSVLFRTRTCTCSSTSGVSISRSAIDFSVGVRAQTAIQYAGRWTLGHTSVRLADVWPNVHQPAYWMAV